MATEESVGLAIPIIPTTRVSLRYLLVISDVNILRGFALIKLIRMIKSSLLFGIPCTLLNECFQDFRTDGILISYSNIDTDNRITFTCVSCVELQRKLI